MTDPVPSFPDPQACQRVRSFLSGIGFGEMPLRRILGIVPPAPVAQVPHPVFRHGIHALDEPLRTLFELFLMGSEMEGSHLRALGGDETLSAFVASGLLAEAGAGYRPTVQLFPFEEFLLASDRAERHAAREADVVPGPGGPTRTLLDFLLPGPVDSVLDLGCGSGILSLRASAIAPRVVATDVNRRAVAFTRFNAELNGIEAVEAREGSLFEPVAGERFDLVLCNAPYAISPARTYLYRDGGTGFVQRVLREVPEHLTGAGTLQMMAEWPQPLEGDWRRWIGEWCAVAGCDVRVLRLYINARTTHAWQWLVQEYGAREIPEEIFREWVAFLDRDGIGSVGGGLILLRRPRRGAPRVEIRDAPPRTPGPVGKQLEGWLATQDLGASLEAESTVLDIRLMPSPGMEREDSREPSGAGWRTGSTRLRLRNGLRFGARVDPVAAEVVGLLDGARTPREALRLLCERHGAPIEPFLGGLPGALRKLMDLGLVVPVEAAAGGLTPTSLAP